MYTFELTFCDALNMATLRKPHVMRLTTALIIVASLASIGGIGRARVQEWSEARNFDLEKWLEAKKEADLQGVRWGIQQDYQKRVVNCYPRRGPELTECIRRSVVGDNSAANLQESSKTGPDPTVKSGR